MELVKIGQSTRQNNLTCPCCVRGIRYEYNQPVPCKPCEGTGSGDRYNETLTSYRQTNAYKHKR